MVIAKTGKEHQAHMKKTWRRIGVDLAARGLADPDIAGMIQDVDVDGEAINGWVFTVQLSGDRQDLVYTLENKDDARILCNGVPLADPGEA